MAHRKPLKAPRSKAFIRQNGLCYYCQQPMWQANPEHFAKQHRLTPAQTRQLQCTGEHLKAHAEGGKANGKNIVAACRYCNQKRHQRPEPLSPDRYQVLVKKRLQQGKWHQLQASLPGPSRHLRNRALDADLQNEISNLEHQNT